MPIPMPTPILSGDSPYGLNYERGRIRIGRRSRVDMIGHKRGLRYETPVGPEVESQPGSRGRVLRNLSGITKKRDMDLAEVHADLLMIHPFREGNGRLARWLAELMALQAGLPLPLYRFTGRGAKTESERYLAAVKAGYLRNYRPLADFFAEAIERGRA